MQAAATGHAHRNPGDAGGLRDLIWLGRTGVNGNRQLEDIGQCCARGECVEVPGYEQNSTDRHCWSAAWNAFIPAGFSIRPGAYLVCDVARSPASRLVLAS